MIDWPKVTEEMQAENRVRAWADLSAVTVCNDCNERNFGYRLGCGCKSENVDWRLQTYDDRLLIPEFDVCIIGDL